MQAEVQISSELIHLIEVPELGANMDICTLINPRHRAKIYITVHDIDSGQPFVVLETFHLDIRFASCELQCLFLRQFTILFTVIIFVYKQ